MQAKSMIGITALALCAGGILAGCGGSGIAGGGDSRHEETPTAPPVPPEVLRAQALDGNWVRLCMPADRLGLSEGQTLEIRDESTVVRRSTVYYAEENCTDPMLTISEEGRVEIGEEVSSGVTGLNLQIQTAQIQVNSENGQKLLEGINACDLKKWPVGETQDVTERTGSINCWQATPREIFDIYALEESRLFLGKQTLSRNATAADARPNELNREVFYRRGSSADSAEGAPILE